MRCPKCGYISFDQLEECSKCSVSIAGSVDAFTGTGVKVEKPYFLASVFEESSGDDSFDLSEAGSDDFSDEGSIAGGLSFDDEGEGSDHIGLAMDEDDEEVAGLDFQLDEAPSEEDIPLEVAGDEDDLEVEGGIDFQFEEDLSGAEEGEDLPELELEPMEDAGIVMDDDEMSDVELESGEEKQVAHGEKVAAPSGELKLDIDVDIDDEPEEDDMVFNLEDIDMSDLVIEDDESEEAAAEKTTEESALDLEDYLSGEDVELDDLPMDLSLDDGDLARESGAKKEKLDDLPEIEL